LLHDNFFSLPHAFFSRDDDDTADDKKQQFNVINYIFYAIERESALALVVVEWARTRHDSVWICSSMSTELDKANGSAAMKSLVREM
jgi:hypothetical protein